MASFTITDPVNKIQSHGTEFPFFGNSKISPGTKSALSIFSIISFFNNLISIEYFDIFLKFIKLFLVSIVESNKLYITRSDMMVPYILKSVQNQRIIAKSWKMKKKSHIFKYNVFKKLLTGIIRSAFPYILL